MVPTSWTSKSLPWPHKQQVWPPVSSWSKELSSAISFTRKESARVAVIAAAHNDVGALVTSSPAAPPFLEQDSHDIIQLNIFTTQVNTHHWPVHSMFLYMSHDSNIH